MNATGNEYVSHPHGEEIAETLFADHFSAHDVALLLEITGTELDALTVAAGVAPIRLGGVTLYSAAALRSLAVAHSTR